MSLHIISGDITIPDGVNLTVNADSNRENVSYTLTCISYGGPVTNVTWTRDNVIIPEGEKATVLNNPRTAQYTHTLTLTGRLDGTYCCTLSNNKPSHDSAQLLIQCNYYIHKYLCTIIVPVYMIIYTSIVKV